MVTAVRINPKLVEKLNPARYPYMSGKMAAIVGCILGESFTEPEIAELVVTSDGYLLALVEQGHPNDLCHSKAE